MYINYMYICRYANIFFHYILDSQRNDEFIDITMLFFMPSPSFGTIKMI